MKISFYDKSDHSEFIDFNALAFPERGEFNKKLIDFRYFNPLNKGNHIRNAVVAYDDESGELIGEALYHPASYYFQNEWHKMEWGFDLFARPDKRTESVGIYIMEFIKANKTGPTFATGVGKPALKMKKFYGYHVIGHLEKFYKIINPIFLATGLLRAARIPTTKFPQKIKSGNHEFSKVTKEQLWDLEVAYNPDLLEFGRDRNFLNWRFYSAGFEYAVYKVSDSETNPLYFVVRTTKIKGITTVMLVDYRFNTGNRENFEIILQAAAKVASRLFLPIVITSSSLRITDDLLQEQGYKKQGIPRPVVSNVKEYKSYKEQIDNRNFVFLTFADSDGEYLM
ncbi:MAG TPA: hypothetical protein VF581_04885 [Flavobacterium sp.]|jgi:hypothetical protein